MRMESASWTTTLWYGRVRAGSQVAPLCTQSPELSDRGCSAPTTPTPSSAVYSLDTAIDIWMELSKVWPLQTSFSWSDKTPSSGGRGKATQELTGSLLTATARHLSLLFGDDLRWLPR